MISDTFKAELARLNLHPSDLNDVPWVVQVLLYEVIDLRKELEEQKERQVSLCETLLRIENG